MPIKEIRYVGDNEDREATIKRGCEGTWVVIFTTKPEGEVGFTSRKSFTAIQAVARNYVNFGLLPGYDNNLVLR